MAKLFEEELQKQTRTGQHIANFIANTKKLKQDNLTVEVLNARLELLENYWKTFFERHELLALNEDYPKTEYASDDVYLQVESSYVLAKGYLKQQINQLSHAHNRQPETPASQMITGKLPKITLPTFSGDYLKWESFRDLFLSLVHDATGLTDVVRLQYLKSSLTGEAAKLLSSIPVTDANYRSAWQMLTARYDNKRLLLNHHFHSLMALKPMTTESPAALRTLLDSTVETRRALENLNRPVAHWDDWFVFLTSQKLEETLKRDWENSLGDGTHLPTFQELEQFLSNRLSTLEVIAPMKKRSSPLSEYRIHTVKTTNAKLNSQAKPFRPCCLCKGNHYLGYCPDFRQKTKSQRLEIVSQFKLCQNCLRDHSSSNCPSSYRCSLCDTNHHTLLHSDENAVKKATPKSLSSAHAQRETNRIRCPTLLATALVKITGSSGQTTLARALLDQGSEATFISEDLTQRLRLPRTKVLVPVTGIGATQCGTVKAAVKIKLSSVEDEESSSINVQAFVLPKLTKAFRPSPFHPSSWPHLRHLKLSDDSSSQNSRIDLVIGADIYGYTLLDGLVKGSPDAPVAQNTIFGWVLSGRMDKPSTKLSSSRINNLHCAIDSSLSEELRKFWEIEEPVQRRLLSPEDAACEERFRNTHSRAPDGRYIVRLPIRPDSLLGASRSTALTIFQRSESRRQRDDPLNQAYRAFMQEYLDLGHMAPAPTTPGISSDPYYLPHHAVWKREGQNQKIRVVFNASAPTSNGKSLNDCLLPGPKLQQDVIDVLLRWRKHAVVFSADIIKMFRQIWVHPDDRNLQRILWRDSPDQRLQEFQLNTVTYGTACAPYLAIRCLQQLAIDEGSRFPEAAKILQSQMYVDDILAGADSLEGAVKIKEQLQGLLTAGGFQLAKWASNSPGLAETSKTSHLLSDGSVKTLGLQWHPQSDTFGFRVNLEHFQQPTKRVVLSCTAKLFDPLGWLAPVLLKAKLFLQDLWTTRSDWDDKLPSSLETAWTNYYHSLVQLQQVQIPRWISITSTSTWEIHGFCDASMRAYAAAVYIRALQTDGSFRSRLLLAKTKVAPLKVLSLPRLELCGAVLLAKLLRRTVDLFQETSKVYAWTDSQVVLCWLQDHPSRWKCFVANRTSDIHQTIPNAIWNHIASGDNPADPASRGISAEELSSHNLWWQGPSWLSQPNSTWPKSVPIQTSAGVQVEENQKLLSLATTCHSISSLQHRYSSLLRLVRVTAWMLRFSHNSRSPPQARNLGPLTTTEHNAAQKVCIRICQAEAFATEIQLLTRNVPLPKGNPLSSLRPFLDPDGLLRVAGRLEHSFMSYAEKHPYILPTKSHFTRLLIIDAHHRVLHGGPQLTLNQLSSRYWILRGRRLVRDLIHSCTRCFRQSARPDYPLMGQLPAVRVTPSRPFQNTGLDYAGPIQIRTTKGRGHKAHKGYIALFVCMTTKAVHLEAVSDYTTDGFIAAFKRFSARRGIPATITSDQATNFRGADGELQRLLQAASRENRKLAERLANDGTQWRFIPPHSPHFGGLWEAGVRSVKHHLRRIVGNHTLTFEELTTVLSEIEACLNSRPITPLSSSAQDYSALTPGHFLIGEPLKTVPEPSVINTPENRLTRWKLLRRLYEQFWRRWSTEYLHHLQQRTKWQTSTPQVQLDDLVLLKEDHLPPSKWCLGRITKLNPGADGIVRVVTVRTATTELQRPVVKVCRLPIEH